MEENQVAVWQLEDQGMTAGVQQTLMIIEDHSLTQRNRHHLALPDRALHMARLPPRKVIHHRTGGMPQSLVRVQEVRVLVRDLESQPGLLQGQCLV